MSTTRPMTMGLALAVLVLSACAGPGGESVPKASAATNMDLSQMIEGILQQADQAIQAQQSEKAHALLQHGLSRLGSHYVMPNLLDESGLKLQLASAEALRGNQAVAANLRRRVLESRLTLYRQKSGSSALKRR